MGDKSVGTSAENAISSVLENNLPFRPQTMLVYLSLRLHSLELPVDYVEMGG